MKTPREILLAQHRAAGPKLDAIRQSAVAAVRDRRATNGQCGERRSQRRSQTAATALFRILWCELVLPSRRLWTGLAAVWLLIVAVNVSQREPAAAGKVTSAPAMMSAREQQRWMNELFADRSLPAEAEPAKTFSPKPRTETAKMLAV